MKKNVNTKSPEVQPDSPQEALRTLVRNHVAMKKLIQSNVNRSTDKKLRDREGKPTGVVVASQLPDGAIKKLKDWNEELSKQKGELERQMEKLLRRVPIYQKFLASVYGCGPVTAAYLATFVRIEKAVKPSNLIRYCGAAKDETGRLERRRPGAGPKAEGGTGTFNQEMRTALYNMFSSMFKLGRGQRATSKYLDVWRNKKRTNLLKGMKSAHQNAMWAAVVVFLDDLYMVWRSLEGLPVWPSFYAKAMGYEHGGKVCVNQPRSLSLDEALVLVGDVGSRLDPDPESWVTASEFEDLRQANEASMEARGVPDIERAPPPAAHSMAHGRVQSLA